MDVRMQLVAHLKRAGPASEPQLRSALGASENALRHHLSRLERDGFVRRALASARRTVTHRRPGKSSCLV